MKFNGVIVIIIFLIFCFGCDADFEDLKFLTDYQAGIESAKKQDKPIFLFFTWYGSSTDEFYRNLALSRSIQKKLNEDFVTVILFADDREKLTKSEIQELEMIDLPEKDKPRLLKSVTKGHVNTRIQVSLFNQYTQPLYAIIDYNGNQLIEPFGYTQKNRTLFLGKLNEGLRNWSKRN